MIDRLGKVLRHFWILGFFVFVAGVAFLSPGCANAALELLARKEIPVFAEQDDIADSIRILERGDHVLISPKKYGAWRKIRLKIKGESQDAWVRAADVKGAIVREVGSAESLATPYSRRYGAGAMISVSNMRQAARVYEQAPPEVSIPIGDSSGFSSYLGLVFDIPLNQAFQLHASLVYRATNLTGKVSFSNGDEPFQLSQSLIGVGALVKYYFSPQGIFWIGAGGEFSKGVNVTLTYGRGSSVPIASSDYPNFLLIQAATGVDLNLFGDVFVIPEFRGGVVVTTKPAMYNFEGMVSFAYAF